MSLMTVSSDSADALDQLEVLALLVVSGRVSRASSVMPMMPFMGVRISWLMLARNSLFARLAASRGLPGVLLRGLRLQSGDTQGDAVRHHAQAR